MTEADFRTSFSILIHWYDIAFDAPPSPRQRACILGFFQCVIPAGLDFATMLGRDCKAPLAVPPHARRARHAAARVPMIIFITAVLRYQSDDERGWWFLRVRSQRTVPRHVDSFTYRRLLYSPIFCMPASRYLRPAYLFHRASIPSCFNMLSKACWKVSHYVIAQLRVTCLYTPAYIGLRHIIWLRKRCFATAWVITLLRGYKYRDSLIGFYFTRHSAYFILLIVMLAGLISLRRLLVGFITLSLHDIAVMLRFSFSWIYADYTAVMIPRLQ